MMRLQSTYQYPQPAKGTLCHLLPVRTGTVTYFRLLLEVTSHYSLERSGEMHCCPPNSEVGICPKNWCS